MTKSDGSIAMTNFKKNNQSIIVVILLILIQVGCNTKPALSITPVRVTQSPSEPGVTRTFILPTLTYTLSPTVTSTLFSTSTKVPTPTVKPSPIPTSIPTLNQAKSDDYLQKLLATNGGCTLPCFLGITPGKTMWDEASSFFSYLGKKIPFAYPYPKYGLQAYGYSLSTKGQLVKIGITIYVHDNEVKLLVFAFNDWLKDANVVKQYSPKEILSKLGTPTQVNFGIMISPYSSDVYPYILNYNFHLGNLWFIVDYEGIALQKGADLLEFCPTDLRQGYQGTRIQDHPGFLVQESDELYSTDDYVNLGTGVSPSSPSLMFATGIDEETFYKKMMGPGNRICFTTPLSKWQQFFK